MWFWLALACGGVGGGDDEALRVLAARVGTLEVEQVKLQDRVVALEANTRDGRMTQLRERFAARRADRAGELGDEDVEPGTLGLPASNATGPALQLDQSLTVRALLADLPGVSSEGRVMPHIGPEGEIDGFRLSAMRRAGLGDVVGFKNGDIVHTVNGLALSSIEQSMIAYQQVVRPDVKALKFAVTRRGEELVVTVPLDQPLSALGGEPAPDED